MLKRSANIGLITQKGLKIVGVSLTVKKGIQAVIAISGVMAFLGGFGATMRFWGQIEDVIPALRHVNKNNELIVTQRLLIEENRAQIQAQKKQINQLSKEIVRHQE